MAAIQLPDLVQRIRVKTDELRKADKDIARTGARFDAMREQASDATDALDELTDATDRYADSAGRVENNASGVIRAIRMLDDASDDSSVSIQRTAQSTGGLRTEVIAVSDAVSGLGDETDSTSHSMDGLARSTNNLNRSFSLSDDRISSVNDSMTRLRTTIKETSREHDNYKKKTDSSGNSTGAFVKKTLAAVGVLGLLKGAFLAIGFAVIIDGLAQIASLLISLAGGAIALTSALAPAVGAVAALPAAFLALKSSTFVFKQITSGASEAIKAIQTFGPASQEAAEALAALNGPTRTFAEAFGQLTFIFNDIRQGIRAVALPDFTQALTLLGPVLRGTRDEMIGLGSVLGNLAVKGAELVSSGPFSRDIQTVLSRNNELVQTLGKAGLVLVNVLRNLVVAAGPMTQTFADLALRGARFLDTVVAAGRRTGDLARFFRSTVEVVKGLIRILVDLGAGLFNVFSLGRDLGDDLFKSIQRGANEFRKWTESAGGRNAILEFFNNARPVITQSAKLIGALVLMFGRLNAATAKTTVAPLLRQLRTELLPALEELLITLSTSGLIGAVAELAQSLVDLANTMPFNPFVELIKGVAALVGWVVKAIEVVPGLGTALAVLGTAFGAFKIAGFVARFIGLGTVFEYLTFIIRTAVIRALWALGAALLATPVGWLILGITALVAAFVLAYQKVEWFRKGVDAAIDFIVEWVRQGFENLVTVTRAVWGFIGPFIMRALDGVRGAVMAVVNFIIDQWQGLVLITQTVWAKIGGPVMAAFNLIRNVVTTALRVVWTVVSTGFRAILAVISTVLGAIWTVIRGYWTIYGGIIVGVLKMIWAQVPVRVQRHLSHHQRRARCHRCRVPAVVGAVRADRVAVPASHLEDRARGVQVHPGRGHGAAESDLDDRPHRVERHRQGRRRGVVVPDPQGASVDGVPVPQRGGTHHAPHCGRAGGVGPVLPRRGGAGATRRQQSHGVGEPAAGVLRGRLELAV